MKRFLAILAVCALAFSLCAPVEAKTAKAATMRLEKTQGTVTLKSGAGKTLTQSDGMKLYSGNSLADAAKSYAWVSLDSSKAVKLGASSSVTVKQSGKKLELNLTSGKLFFDVKTPLASDESLSIRTSTTVTGIRGTCGVVEVTKDSKTGEDCTRVTIFEGSVVVTTAEPAAGTTNTLTVSAGKWMQITSDNGRVVNGTIDDTSDLGFAMVDIAADPALLARINAATALGEKIKTTAAKQLAIDEGDEQKAIDALPANKIVVTDPVFSEPVYVGGGGGGGGSYVPPVTNDQIELDITQDFGTLTANQTAYEDTTGKVQQALNDYNVVYIKGAGSTLNISTAGFTIPENKILNISSGTVDLTGDTATVNGTLNINGNTAYLKNHSALTNNSSHSINNYGQLYNYNTITNSTTGYLKNWATFNNESGTFSNVGTFENVGTVENRATFTNSGTINNSQQINTIQPGVLNLLTGGKINMSADGSILLSNGSSGFQINSNAASNSAFLNQLITTDNGVFLMKVSTSSGGYVDIRERATLSAAITESNSTSDKANTIRITKNEAYESEIDVANGKTLTLTGSADSDNYSLFYNNQIEANNDIVPTLLKVESGGTLILDNITLSLAADCVSKESTVLLKSDGTVNAVGTCKISNLFGGTAYASGNTIGQGDTKQNTAVYITAKTKEKAWNGASGENWETDQVTGATYYISYTAQP